MIDIEEELKQVQIKHIKKELEQLRMYYDDFVDLKFIQILCNYEEMLELATSNDERLLLYKRMYQDSTNYIVKGIQNTQPNKDFEGTDNANTNSNKDNDNLPFCDSVEAISGTTSIEVSWTHSDGHKISIRKRYIKSSIMLAKGHW